MTFSRRTVLKSALGGTALTMSGLSIGKPVSALLAEGGVDGSLARYMDQHRAEWGIPGMVVALADGDGFEQQLFSGVANLDSGEAVNKDHLFQVGSISKMMAALALWSQIDDGLLTPDAPLNKLLPEIPIDSVTPITLKHILDHTSGLPRGTDPFHEGGLWTGTAPGTHWAYSNLGYKLAGMIAGRIDGTSFKECVEKRLLRPLGMTSSKGALITQDRQLYAKGYEPDRLERPNPLPTRMANAPWADYDGASGCIAATGADMSKFIRFLIGLTRGTGGPVFSDETATRFLLDPSDAPGWANGAKYGNGIAFMRFEGQPYLHHTGGMMSFTSSIHIDIDAGVGCFASANVHYGTSHRPRNVSYYGCQILKAHQVSGPQPNAPAIRQPVNRPDIYTGTYKAADGTSLTITASDAGLSVDADGASAAVQLFGTSLGATDHQSFADTGLIFEFATRKADRVWVGHKEYLLDPTEAYTKTPERLLALAGYYIGESRWDIANRIYAHGDHLTVTRGNYVSRLYEQPNGDWVAGDASKSADWVRFGDFIDGVPQTASSSGKIQKRIGV